MHSDTVKRRERRVMIGGVAVVALALTATLVVVPFVRQWRDREAEIAATQERVALLERLAARTESLEAEANAAERALAVRSRRVMHARSTTLAASSLQSLLQDMADASPLVVTRLEVSADDSTSTGGAAATARIPATFSAYGDIAGVASFLHHLAVGPRVLVLDRLTVQRNAALLGAPDVVQVTMAIHAPVITP